MFLLYIQHTNSVNPFQLLWRMITFVNRIFEDLIKLKAFKLRSNIAKLKSLRLFSVSDLSALRTGFLLHRSRREKLKISLWKQISFDTMKCWRYDLFPPQLDHHRHLISSTQIVLVTALRSLLGLKWVSHKVWPTSLFLFKKKCSHSMTLPTPCFTVQVVCSGWCMDMHCLFSSHSPHLACRSESFFSVGLM